MAAPSTKSSIVKVAGVCFRRENDLWEQDQWSHAFSNFGITEIWERKTTGVNNPDFKIYQPTIGITTAAELPSDRPLVVLAPKDGRYIQGVESLIDFVHPEHAIYLFGGSHVNLSDADDLGGRVPDHIVYIPSAHHEMYSHAAGYIVLYDRYVKRGTYG